MVVHRKLVKLKKSSVNLYNIDGNTHNISKTMKLGEINKLSENLKVSEFINSVKLY